MYQTASNYCVGQPHSNTISWSLTKTKKIRRGWWICGEMVFRIKFQRFFKISLIPHNFATSYCYMCAFWNCVVELRNKVVFDTGSVKKIDTPETDCFTNNVSKVWKVVQGVIVQIGFSIIVVDGILSKRISVFLKVQTWKIQKYFLKNWLNVVICS